MEKRLIHLRDGNIFIKKRSSETQLSALFMKTSPVTILNNTNFIFRLTEFGLNTV